MSLTVQDKRLDEVGGLNRTNPVEDPFDLDIRELKATGFDSEPNPDGGDTWLTTVTVISVTKYVSLLIKVC